MEINTLSLTKLREAPWNANEMTPDMLARLRESVTRFGVVENTVVRPLSDCTYEVLSGNQRLKVYRQLGMESAPCVVVPLDDIKARLLAQVLNRTRGQDDLGIKADLVRSLLDSMPEEDVSAILPETSSSLQALASSLGRESMAEGLRKWQQAQAAKLRHLTLQFTDQQLSVVEEALERVLPLVSDGQGNPNRRSNALYLLCLSYLEQPSTPGIPEGQRRPL